MLRNAAIPIVTVSGLTIASLIALAAVVETAFNLNGLGEYLVTAALNDDFATVQGISLVLVTVFVVTNAIVDILYAVLDPRVTLGAARDELDRAGSQRDAAGGPAATRGAGRARDLRVPDRSGHVCAAVRCRGPDRSVRPADRPYDPNQLNISYAFVGAHGNHYLGFDGQGRDLFSRLLAGARSSLLGPLLVAVLAVVTGPLLAVAAAWIGGWFDASLAMVLDVLFAFPGFCWPSSPPRCSGRASTSAVCALSIAYLPYVARVLRGAGLRERVTAVRRGPRGAGIRRATRICLRHLLPNIASLVVAQGTILFGWAMVDLAAISFLGLGVQAPQADWGVMIADGKVGVFEGYPLEAVTAAPCIIVVVTAVSLLGERSTNERKMPE